MAKILDLRTFTNDKGHLTVIEKILPFDIKRVFYIYGVDDSIRGGHNHKKTIQAAVCIQGSCTIFNTDGKNKAIFQLNSPSQCLIIEPKDWHEMYDFSKDAILMVFASEYFDANDYVYKKPNK